MLIGAAVVTFLVWKLRTSHFDWAGFARSWRSADLGLLALATAILYANYLLRALRWALFLKPAYAAAGRTPVPWWRLVGSQFVGFTGLALFGRIGELIRPLLIARRTGLPMAAQVGVLTVERVFDLGAFALIFSLNLVLARGLDTLPFHEKFRLVGLALAAMTALVAVFVLAVRLAGPAVGALVRRLVGLVSQRAGELAEGKVLAFRTGLDVIRTRADFFSITLLSLGVWAAIALGYVLVMRAFPAPVHALTVADTLLLMGFSVVGGIVQLPGVGGGAQFGTISALTLLFGIPRELAVSAGLILWLVTTMSVIPAGLVCARLEGVSLRESARESEHEEASAAAPLLE